MSQRTPAKPWELDATVVIPHKDTPEWLAVTVEMWLCQDRNIFLLVVDTGSQARESQKILAEIEKLPNAEVARLGIGNTEHTSDRICAAMDYAFSRCPTEFLISTHVDVFPRHRGLVSYLLGLCDRNHPVVGWEMSPRGFHYEGRKITEGYVGHACTIFHMPTMDTCGAGWSLRRSYHAFGSPRHFVQGFFGWPDTETGLGEILKKHGIKPLFLGRETNFENQRTEHWVHARGRTWMGLTERHRIAILEAKQLLSTWKTNSAAPISSCWLWRIFVCPYRNRSGDFQKAACELVRASVPEKAHRYCSVDLEICGRCCSQDSSGYAPENNAVLRALVLKAWHLILQRRIIRVCRLVRRHGEMPQFTKSMALSLENLILGKMLSQRSGDTNRRSVNESQILDI